MKKAETKKSTRTTPPDQADPSLIEQLREETGLDVSRFERRGSFVQAFDLKILDRKKLEAGAGKKLARTGYVVEEVNVDGEGWFYPNHAGSYVDAKIGDGQKTTVKEMLNGLQRFVSAKRLKSFPPGSPSVCGHCNRPIRPGEEVSSCSGDSHERCRQRCAECN